MPGYAIKEFNLVEVAFCNACGENMGPPTTRYGNPLDEHGVEDCIRSIVKRLDEMADNCPGR